MKWASFLGAVVLCLASLFYWICPKALLVGLLVSLAATIGFAVFFLFHRKRWLRDILFALCCFVVSTLILYFPVTDYYDTVETFDGATCTVTVQLTGDPELTSSGSYRYTARPVEKIFSQKIVFFSPQYYTDGGGDANKHNWVQFFGEINLIHKHPKCCGKD